MFAMVLLCCISRRCVWICKFKTQAIKNCHQHKCEIEKPYFDPCTAKCTKLKSRLKRKEEKKANRPVHLIEATRLLDRDSSGHFISVQCDWIAAEMVINHLYTVQSSTLNHHSVVTAAAGKAATTTTKREKNPLFYLNISRSNSIHLFVPCSSIFSLRDLCSAKKWRSSKR